MNPRTLLLVLGLLGAIPLGMRLVHAGEPEVVESYFADGTLESRTFVHDGEREGLSQRFWKDGSLRSEGRYENDRRVGRWVWYREDGTPDPELSGRYEAGERVAPL